MKKTAMGKTKGGVGKTTKDVNLGVVSGNDQRIKEIRNKNEKKYYSVHNSVY